MHCRGFGLAQLCRFVGPAMSVASDAAEHIVRVGVVVLFLGEGRGGPVGQLSPLECLQEPRRCLRSAALRRRLSKYCVLKPGSIHCIRILAPQGKSFLLRTSSTTLVSRALWCIVFGSL